MSTFDLKIVTPKSDFYNGEIEYLSFNTTDGSVGFMRGALPRITVVKEGKLVIKSQTVNETFYCGDGIVRVKNDGITVIVSYCSKDGPMVLNDDEAFGNGKKGFSEKDYKYLKARLVSTIRDIK
ncbi:MAG: F0F1 ATP synthase subunit epsilon [Clostridiales bacterium]|nr:F0F1 ATP synthase subunit epsilon [Clostridiales bacterium]